MRKLGLVLAFLALALAAGLGTRFALSHPRWALYQMGRGIYQHDADLFLAYLDLERILARQHRQILAAFLPGEKKAKQREILSQVVKALTPALSRGLRQQLAILIEDRKRQNLPNSWTLAVWASVRTNGDFALVALSNPQRGERLRLGMQRQADGHWRVVQVNIKDLLALSKRYAPKLLPHLRKDKSP